MWDFLYAVLLLANSLAVLNEQRFLVPYGLGFHQLSNGQTAPLKVQVVGLIHAVQLKCHANAGEGSTNGGEGSGSDSDEFRQRMEGLVNRDDDSFDGKQLAALIYQKYSRSYDVQLIRKEFLGRQLLAMNVMWKYREQKSFPLTKEEYLYRLDRVAENLRCLMGLILLARLDSVQAVSIRIDLDQTNIRANEWIQR
ncbi:unnamed protein product [Closterium sp. NIES-65]|nr:unnamed protein product [Closterium sp. NIES-65]